MEKHCLKTNELNLLTVLITKLYFERRKLLPELCNETRLQDECLRENITKPSTLRKYGKEEPVLISRTQLIPSDHTFDFKHLQLPILPS
jgi:hypothetical protein